MEYNKRLIILTYDFPPSNGGIARLCTEIAEKIGKHYSYVEVVTRGTEVGTIKHNNFHITRFNEQRIVLEYKIWKYIKRLRNNGTTILCGVWHPEGLIAQFAGFKNIFILAHGTEYLHGNSTWRKKIWLNIYCKYVLKNANTIIANSDYTMHLVKEICNEAKVVTIPLGVDENKFNSDGIQKFKDNKLKIASLSRILKFKGYDFIAQTLASLPERYRENVEWNIGGKGPYLEELKNLVKILGINNLTFFHGFVAEDYLKTFYLNNDIFVLCTREQNDSVEVEGFGLVFLEAQACGLPVIATNTGGIASAVEDGNGGWLIDQDNITELRNLIMKIIDREYDLDTISKAARKRVEKSYTWELYNSKLFNQMQNDSN
ncbi:glycosyltransferase family 4 protein [Empedobacter sp.]|uniref:glycosyltransferase family 4 protein n=1 Tax=Empedobacter sp. TaxID=1927715 RepID=UPI00289DE310|nr:glycosyltransferase family 4 protein [Empedobacter sp.]